MGLDSDSGLIAVSQESWFWWWFVVVWWWLGRFVVFLRALERRRNSFIARNIFIVVAVRFCCYNHATSNLAIYSHETSQDKLSEA